MVQSGMMQGTDIMTKPPNRTMGGTPPFLPLRLAGLNILVIEDEALVAFDVEELLLQNGASSVEITSSLAVAREILAVRLPALVILDVKLTDGSGLELLPLLRQLAVGVVITTGYSGLEIDLHPIVSKPYSGEQLIAAILMVSQSQAR
jgi:DNA-binding response OmpR family regulator